MRYSLYLFFALCAAGLLYGTGLVAHEDHHHPKSLPDVKDSINFRHYLMENIGDNYEEMKDKLEDGQIKEMAVNARAIALHSTRIPELFPQGTTSDSSRAKEEIWQRWEDFLKAAQTLRAEADQLAMTVAHGKANSADAQLKEAADAQLKKVAGACKSCHDQFRKPEEKEEAS